MVLFAEECLLKNPLFFESIERLRRMDESIRTTLGEKQKIVCDIFRLPNEHFSAIADIAGQPEAPKVTKHSSKVSPFSIF